jgi:uncharacterized protein YndB with AHSA1/START domain
MSTITEPALATQVYAVFIKATPEQVWDAITKPEFTHKYFYGAHITVAADSYRSVGDTGDELVRGAIVEYDPPRRLSHSWSAQYDPATASEPESRVTWELEAQDGGVTKVTVVHDRLEASPNTAQGVAGGWSYVLSGLKTLLETGTPLQG